MESAEGCVLKWHVHWEQQYMSSLERTSNASLGMPVSLAIRFSSRVGCPFCQMAEGGETHSDGIDFASDTYVK